MAVVGQTRKLRGCRGRSADRATPAGHGLAALRRECADSGSYISGLRTGGLTQPVHHHRPMCDRGRLKKRTFHTWFLTWRWPPISAILTANGSGKLTAC